MGKSYKLIFFYFVIVLTAAFLPKVSSVFAQTPPLKDAMQLAMFDAMREREIALAPQKIETRIVERERGKERERCFFFFVFYGFPPAPFLPPEYKDIFFFLKADTKGDIINTLDAGVLFSMGPDIRSFASPEENKLDFFIGAKALAYSDNTRLDDYYPYGILSSRFARGRHKFMLDQSYKEYFSRSSLLTTGTGGMLYYSEINTPVNYEAEFHRLGYELGYISDIFD